MEDERVDLGSYIRIARRWWWALILGVVIGAVAGHILTDDSPVPAYETGVKLLVQSGNTPGVPSASDIQTSKELASSYSDLLKTRPILGQVVDELSLPYGPDTLANKINVTTPRTLMLIKARDTDPEMAALIANTTARKFIDDIRNRQLTQIARFQASLGQFGLAQDPAIIAAQASTMTTLSIIEDAIPSTSPINTASGASRGITMGAIAGLVAAAVLVFLIENLDDRIKSPGELKSLTGMTTLGSVLQQSSGNGGTPVILTDVQGPNSLAESYKFLHTNLEFANLENGEWKSLLITSASPEEGKTTTASNLSISVAREGKSVVLVDADLRKPSLNRIFGLEGHKGLTHVVAGSATLEEAMAQTSVPGLRVIPSGPLPPDASAVLRSSKVREIVRQLSNHADIVIFDSPPLLSVTDPLLLVPYVDSVLMVVDAQRTKRGAVRRGAEALHVANARVAGTVLNKVTAGGGGNNYYYYYRSYYGAEENGHRQRGRSTGVAGAYERLRAIGDKVAPIAGDRVSTAYHRLEKSVSSLRRRGRDT